MKQIRVNDRETPAQHPRHRPAADSNEETVKNDTDNDDKHESDPLPAFEEEDHRSQGLRRLAPQPHRRRHQSLEFLYALDTILARGKPAQSVDSSESLFRKEPTAVFGPFDDDLTLGLA